MDDFLVKVRKSLMWYNIEKAFFDKEELRMSENMLNIRDLKLISADAYARGAMGVTAETVMDVAADVVDMLIVREHYKISSALHIVGMTAEQYVAVRSKNGKRWWKNRDEIEDEMKEEEEQEEAEKTEDDVKKQIDREVLLPIWEKVKNGTINWQEELDKAADNRTVAAILNYKNKIEESDYEQYSDRLKKTLASCIDKGMSLKEVLKHFRENAHWLIRRCAKEIGYENDAECTPEKDDKMEENDG